MCIVTNVYRMREKVSQLMKYDDVDNQSADQDEQSTLFYCLPTSMHHARQSVLSHDDGQCKFNYNCHVISVCCCSVRCVLGLSVRRCISGKFVNIIFHKPLGRISPHLQFLCSYGEI